MHLQNPLLRYKLVSAGLDDLLKEQKRRQQGQASDDSESTTLGQRALSTAVSQQPGSYPAVWDRFDSPLLHAQHGLIKSLIGVPDLW